MTGFSGGYQLQTKLSDIAAKLGKATDVKVGFVDGAIYPDGTSVAYVATIQEFGGTFNIPERTQTIYRKVDKNGDFANGGKFVKSSRSNFASDHNVPAHTLTIPPRPYFRQMIAEKSAGWGASLGAAMKAYNYDTKAALNAMGEVIEDQLKVSIGNFEGVPLAASTIAAKGFDTPLIDTGVMLRSVTFKVSDE